MKRPNFARTAIAVSLTAIGPCFWWQYFSGASPLASIGGVCVTAGTKGASGDVSDWTANSTGCSGGSFTATLNGFEVSAISVWH